MRRGICEVDPSIATERPYVMPIGLPLYSRKRWKNLFSRYSSTVGINRKLNAVDPFAYLSAALPSIVNGHKQSRADEPMPWNYSGRTHG